MAASFLRPMTQDPTRTWTLRAVADGRCVARILIPAFDRETRNKGLLGRRSLDTGSALILAPCNGVHTFFMKFAIDIVFVSRPGRVLKIRADCRPWRLAFTRGAFAVIELPAGGAASSALAVGDELELV